MSGISDLVPGHKLCCACAELVPIEDLFIDDLGQKWDMCKPCGEREAGAHDPLCPQRKSRILACDCEFIALIRADERKNYDANN